MIYQLEKKIQAVDNEIKKFFKPEFLNRLDEIVVFNNLELNDIKEIAKSSFNI